MTYNPKWAKKAEDQHTISKLLDKEWPLGNYRKMILNEIRIQNPDGFKITDPLGNTVIDVSPYGNITFGSGLSFNEITNDFLDASPRKLLTSEATHSLVLSHRGIAEPWTYVDTDIFASHGNRLAVNTDNTSVTIYLPNSPVFGNEIWILDAMATFGKFPCILNGNGHNIEGSSSDYILDIDRADVELIYINKKIGWRVKG